MAKTQKINKKMPKKSPKKARRKPQKKKIKYQNSICIGFMELLLFS